MVKDGNRDSATARYTSPHDADVKTLCKQECARIVHSKRCRYALIPLALFLTILVIYVIFDYPPDPPPSVCLSAACIRTGWNLKQAMNLRENPCDDFYAHVCGGNWTKLADKQRIGEGRNPLVGNVSQEDPSAVKLAKRMFQACMSKDDRKSEDFSHLTEFYGRFGLPTLPTVFKRSAGLDIGEDHKFNWVDSAAKIRRFLGLNVLVGVDVSDANVLVLGYPGLPKDWDALLSRTQVEQVGQLLEPVQTVANNMLQVAINSAWNVTDRDKKFEDLGYQVQDFFRMLPNQSSNASDQAIFGDLDPNLQDYLNILFEDLPHSKPTSNEPLQIDRQYLKDLVKTVSAQNPEQIELFVWGFVSNYLVRHRFNRAGGEDFCSKQVQHLMSPVISFMQFEDNNRDNLSVGLILSTLRSVLDQQILAIDWMDQPSRNASLTAVRARFEVLERIYNASKLNHYFKELQVGDSNLENWINGLAFVTGNQLKSWRTTYEAQWNPAFLQKPFRDLGLNSLNYGSLGITVLTELLSGLPARLSNSSFRAYQDQSRCFADSRSAQDAAGLWMAAEAYQKAGAGAEQELPLPGEFFTGEQALFIAYGWQICNGDRSERSKLRINEAVRNVGPFSKAFECPAGSAMNPEVRCEVW